MNDEYKPTLLLHSCCAPCSSAVLERLTPDYNVTVFFYNPNILPFDEYQKRLSEQKRFLATAYGSEHCSIDLIEGDYDVERFMDVIRGLEHFSEGGERCEKCYLLRLEETARIGQLNRFEYFATTLTLSSKKKAAVINPIAERMSEKYGIKTILADFKKKDGYNRSIELCNEYGLYRQNYCGCKVKN